MRPRQHQLIRIAQIDRVDVYFHWSTLAAAALVILVSVGDLRTASVRDVRIVLVGIVGYLGIILVHEWGHVVVARRRGCTAFSIEVYPILGLTRHSAPYSRFDDCLIAWGGVAAQLVVALPLIAWAALFGEGQSEATGVIVAMLGFFSTVIAVLNLLPFPRLDGAKAWAIVPLLAGRMLDTWRRKRARDRPRPNDRRSDWRRW